MDLSQYRKEKIAGTNKRKHALVFAYADWCGHCVALGNKGFHEKYEALVNGEVGKKYEIIKRKYPMNVSDIHRNAKLKYYPQVFIIKNDDLEDENAVDVQIDVPTKSILTKDQKSLLKELDSLVANHGKETSELANHDTPQLDSKKYKIRMYRSSQTSKQERLNKKSNYNKQFTLVKF